MKTVLFLSKGEDSSSTRYRAMQYFPLLEAAGIRAQHCTMAGGVSSYLMALNAARSADVVVVLRKTLPPPLLQLLRLAARRLVFDFDDAIFCNTDGTHSPTRMSRFIAMSRSCDHVIAGNEFLANEARRHNSLVTVIPTAINYSKYQSQNEKVSDAIDLVWIGSSATRKYLADVLPWIELAAQDIPNLRLKIIADFDLPSPRVTVLPTQWSSETEVAEIHSSHIGIAPLRDDDWSRGKCGLKILQYMAAGLPVISSSYGANGEIVRDGVDGLLADTQNDWVDAINRLAHDASLRYSMGNEAKQRIESTYSLEVVFEKIIATLRNQFN